MFYYAIRKTDNKVLCGCDSNVIGDTDKHYSASSETRYELNGPEIFYNPETQEFHEAS